MGRKSKRFREIEKLYDPLQQYGIDDAIDILKKCPPAKFDQSVEVAIYTGVDPRKSDQLVRGTVPLPNGTGKTLRILVLAKGDKAREAKEAGADFTGDQDLVEKIKNGWMDFDAIIATPDMMREVGKLGKVLGPRGLMPTPKAGTVTTDVAQAVRELKSGRVEFKADKHGVINNAIGKLSFNVKSIAENLKALIQAVLRAKPAAAKGAYIKSMTLSSTMGPGIRVDLREIESANA